jgi:hypothetical protein
MQDAKKWVMVCVCLALGVGMFGCGASTIPLPDIARVWTETATLNNQTTQTGIFSFDAQNNLVTLQSGLSQSDLDALAQQFKLTNVTVQQNSDTLQLANDITMVTVNGTLDGQQVSIAINGKLLDGTLTNSAGQITVTYRSTTSIPAASFSSTYAVTKTGTLSADGKTITFSKTSVSQDGGQPVEKDSTAVWTLQSGSALQ